MWGAIAAAAPIVANYFSQQETNRANRDIANSQMAFQERMRSTQHQTEVQDLKAAGLNPTLSAGGSGAGTPPGAGTTLTAPQIQMPDLLLYGTKLKELELADQRLAIDKANSAAGIAKSLSETELNKAEKILKQKGLIRAEAEGEAAKMLRKLFDKVKNIKSPNFQLTPPKQRSLKNPIYSGE